MDTTLGMASRPPGVFNREKRASPGCWTIWGHQIEASIPVMGGDEKQVIREMVGYGLKASIMAWNRTWAISGIRWTAGGCGYFHFRFRYSYNPQAAHFRQWVLEHMTRAVERPQSGRISVNGEDASLWLFDLVKFVKEARAAGGSLPFCDTVGCWNPSKLTVISRLIDATGMK